MGCPRRASGFLSLALLCSGVLVRSSPSCAAEALVIDHSAVAAFDRIPDSYIAEAKKMWLNFPGESHASGYRKGLALLAQQNPKYAAVVTEYGAPAAYRTDALRISGLNRNQYNNWDGGAGEDKWYADSSKRALLKNHLTYCNTNNLEIAAMGFGWCWDMTFHNAPGGTVDPAYQVRWAGASAGGPQGDLRWGLDEGDVALTGNSVTMETYLQATEEYAEYCRVNGYRTKVLFTTGPVDGYSGESGYQRQLKHDYLRDFVKADAGRILFDYADILSFSDAGQENTQSWNAHAYQMIHPDNMKDLNGSYAEDGDHIGQIGALRLGKALWVLAARLAGWQPVFVYGDVSGDARVSAYDAALAAQAGVGLVALAPDQIVRADVSGGGEVSAYDAALIAQYAVGLIGSFPVETR